MKPKWLKVKLPVNDHYEKVKQMLKKEQVETVCIEAKCPNRIECWGRKSMTFMILGRICTRNCRFCAVQTGNPNEYLDKSEPEKIARIVKNLGLSHIVITSVTRDDLADGGASVFANTVNAIKNDNDNVLIEVLVPDFSGDESSIRTVIESGCDLFSHNIETVKRLTPIVRDRRASYTVSLGVLNTAHRIKTTLTTKSGIMLGLGETEDEIRQALKDLIENNVKIVTIGQYLQPSGDCLPVADYISPETFKEYKDYALELGFSKVMAGPLVRSSYFYST